MKFLKLLTLTLAFAFATTGRADDANQDPCIPTVKAQPSVLFCREGNLGYAITLQTLMAPKCPTGHPEITSALVKISHGEKELGQISLNPGTFEVEGLSPTAAIFKSEVFKLNLKCIRPMQGGFSIGN